MKVKNPGMEAKAEIETYHVTSWTTLNTGMRQALGTIRYCIRFQVGVNFGTFRPSAASATQTELQFIATCRIGTQHESSPLIAHR